MLGSSVYAPQATLMAIMPSVPKYPPKVTKRVMVVAIEAVAIDTRTLVTEGQQQTML